MKKIVSLIIILFAINCSAKEKSIKSKTIEKNKPISIIGKIEIYSDKSNYDVYIVVNWKSKSRVSYKVVNDKAKLLKNYKNKIIEAKGIILKEYSMWSKDFKLLSFKQKK